MKTFSYLWQHLAEFFFEWEMFHTEVVQKIKTHLGSMTFPPENHAVYDNVEKCGGAREATEENKVHALYMLGK